MKCPFCAELENKVIDSRLSNYLYRYSSDTGILVARPLR